MTIFVERWREKGKKQFTTIPLQFLLDALGKPKDKTDVTTQLPLKICVASARVLDRMIG
jgi:hypothetical protein